MKPKYHIYPSIGFLNDPNGLYFYKGTYHVFFQWLPKISLHGAKIWKEMVSNDLIHWTSKGILLKPQEFYEKNGCYSGSALVNDRTVYFFYTGNLKEQKQRISSQCLAIRKNADEYDVRKYGVILEKLNQYTSNFRDPYVWKKINFGWP